MGKSCYTISQEAKWEESHTREINPLEIINREHIATTTDTRKWDYVLKIHLFTYQVVYLLFYWNNFETLRKDAKVHRR